MKILIIGAGAYGLALSNVLNDKNKITIYSSLKNEIDNLKNTHKNETLFPNITLPNNIEFTNKIENIKTDIILIALPTNIIEQEIIKIKENIKNIPIIIASKGIYKEKFVHEIIKEILPDNQLIVLSGPSFAKDLIEKQNITLTLAGKNIENIKQIFNEEYNTIETTEDIIGTEICGTLKNIFAIGSGILEGLNKSESTKASYLTKIINEIKIIVEQFNGNKETILLSCGIGDIILTCTSKSSRNYKLGYLIGNKIDTHELEEYIKKTTIEGLNSLVEFKKIINKKHIESKTLDNIYEIIYNNKKPEEIL